MIKVNIMTLILFLSIRVFASDLCHPKIPYKPLYVQSDQGRSHVLFVRCHPTLPLIFSNQIPLGKDEMSMRPVMIDMRDGKQTIIPFATSIGDKGNKKYSAVDFAPSPDGKLLFGEVNSFDDKAPIYEKYHNYLGVYDINNYQLHELDLVSINGEVNYNSPAIHNDQLMLLGRESRDNRTGGSRGIPYLYSIIKKGDHFSIKKSAEICSSEELDTSNTSLNMPYISLDAEYFGTNKNNILNIYKLRWDKITEINGLKQIPCDVVTTLPPNSGKVSFSPDNKQIVFHVNRLNFLGKSVLENESEPESVVMDLATGKMMQISDAGRSNKTSDYPFYCGKQGIVVRETLQVEPYGSTFKIIPNPDFTTKVSIHSPNNECTNMNAQEHSRVIKFWEDICKAIDAKYEKLALDVNVTPENCTELIKTWGQYKGNSSITEQDIRAACQMGA